MAYSNKLVVTSCVIVSLLSPSMTFHVKDFLKEGIAGTWDSAPPSSATIFFCSEGAQGVMKELSTLGFTLRLAQPRLWVDALNSIRPASPQGRHTIVLDLQCPMADHLLRKATKVAIIRSPYRWLVLNVTNDEQTDGSCHDLAAEISANGSALAEGKASDADVVLVCRGLNSLNMVDLWGPTTPTILGKWSPYVESRFQSDRKPPAVRRLANGLNGYVFRTAFVITNNNTYNHLNDGVQKQYDFMTKFNYEVCHIMAKVLNATMHTIFTDHWGYKINGTWNGLVGLLDRREAEIGGTPNSILHSRLSIQTFLNYHTPAKATFVFREPPMSYVHNLFTRPFPMSLWLSIIGILLLGAILLYAVLRLEEVTGVKAQLHTPKVAEGRKGRLHASWSDVALLTFGAVCQQGSPNEARGYPGRIVTVFLFFGILFLYTAYSACIVTLLQSTTTNIRHFKDFLDSPIELGIQNVSYNVYYISNANDTYRRRIYLEKLIKYGRYNAFMNLEEGMKKVQTSYFAFFGLRSNVYQTISDTFQEHEKCGLREVDNDFLLVSNPHMTVGKWSPHAELLRIALRKIQERGIRQRQLQRFMSFKPVCVNQAGNFQSVSLIDCYAAFLVLAGGFGLSVFLLIFETFVYPRVAHLTCTNVKRTTNTQSLDFL